MAAKNIKSDQPTIMIAPSDYEHIFKGGATTTTTADQSVTTTTTPTKIKKIESDQPTIMIAPSDYEHIFKGGTTDQSANAMVPKKNTAHTADKLPIGRITSETPTMLIAPSDFQHIYCDPMLSTTRKDNEIPRPPPAPPMNNRQNHPNRTSSMRTIQNRSPPAATPTGQHQEVLPKSILRLINAFISKQKPTYTINQRR